MRRCGGCGGGVGDRRGGDEAGVGVQRGGGGAGVGVGDRCGGDGAGVGVGDRRGDEVVSPPRRCVDGMYDALESLFVIVGTSRFRR